jgi:hypothetical protein
MRLSDEDAARFYAAWRPLLTRVNDERHVVAKLHTDPDGPIHGEDAFMIRKALWADDTLRERFVAENPAALSPDLLSLVDSWGHRRSGTFFLWKHYKKHSVFLEDDEGFAVLGLCTPLGEMFVQEPPILVDAVLLPFGDRIVYDGLITARNVLFGSGIRRNLREQYRAALEKGAIHTSLGPARATPAATRLDSATMGHSRGRASRRGTTWA